MLADVGGSVGQGVDLFVERLYKIDAGAAVAGVRSGGGACFRRFGAEETVALQRLLGISGAKRKLLASILCKRNSGNSVIASNKEVDKLDCTATEARNIYGVYTYTHVPKGYSHEEQVEVRYRVTCPFFQLKKHLEAMRDSLDWKKLGVLLGRQG
jgi:hypothetical protein